MAIGDFVCGICVSLVSGIIAALLTGLRRAWRSLKRPVRRQANGIRQGPPDPPTAVGHSEEWDPELVSGGHEALVQLGHTRAEASRLIELTMAAASTSPSSIEALIREVYRSDRTSPSLLRGT